LTNETRNDLGRFGWRTVRTQRHPGRLQDFGPRDLGPAEFGAFLAREDARWGAIVKSSGVKIE